MVQRMECESCGFNGEVFIERFSLREPTCPECGRESLYEPAYYCDETEEDEE